MSSISSVTSLTSLTSHTPTLTSVSTCVFRVRARQMAAADSKAVTASPDVQLFAAIDAALQPFGVVSDLSRIIAQFARPTRWAYDSRVTFSGAEGCTATVNAPVPDRWMWLVSGVPIGQFPIPSDAKDGATSAVRKWTIRVEEIAFPLHIGICKPSSAQRDEAASDPHSISVCTSNCYVDVGHYRHNRNIPFIESYEDAGGSLYHFTADLSTGTLRVRPIIKRVHSTYRPDVRTCTEWTIAEGLTELADCRASVALYTKSEPAAFTLLL
jgi:hypothetical protein